MSQLSARRKKSTSGKYVAGGCGVLVLLFAVWWMAAEAPPAIRIPMPAMPNPNAFDTFELASSQLLEAKKIDTANYTAADAKRAGVAVLTLSDREKLVAENAPTLATLRQGLEQSYCNPPIRSFYARMPYYAKFRGLARFLALDAGVHLAKSDYGGAARSSMDAIAMGAQIPHGSTVIGGFVGIACQAIGRKTLWRDVDHLNADQVRDAVLRMEKIRQNELPVADILQQEKWAGQAGLMEFFRKKNPGNLFALMSTGPQTPQTPAVNSVASSLFYLVYSKQRIMNDYTSFMDADIKRAKEPYRPQHEHTPVGHDPLVEILAPVSEGMVFKSLANRTQNGLLETTLALRAYKLAHGAYPATLADLSPQIMKTQPTDPFTAGQPFRYKRTGTSFILYSVGPDGTDDGGRPIDAGPGNDPSNIQRYRVDTGSKGDIVAGKNLW